MSFSKALPYEVNMDANKLYDMLCAGEEVGYDSVAILKDDKLVLESYNNPVTKDMPHVMYSATKSVISTLAGLLIDDGLMNLDDKILSFFPEIQPDKMNNNKEIATVENYLTMTTGHDVDSIEAVMTSPSPDWAKVVLDQASPLLPGSKFVYDSGASYVIANIVSRVCGTGVREFAEQRLFGHMGIENYRWQTCPKGVHNGGWGLYLTTRDMLKFGKLFLQEGVWEGKQLVPKWWVKQASSKHLDTGANNDRGYGYKWWRTPWGYSAAGMGGQLIFVCPDYNMVVAVTTSGSGDGNDMPEALMEQYIVPGIVDNAIYNKDAQKQLDDKVQEHSKEGNKKPVLKSYDLNEFNGKLFNFENSMRISELKLSFYDDDGQMHIGWKDSMGFDHMDNIRFGLDGIYRTSDMNKGLANSGLMEYTTWYAKGKFTGDRIFEITVRLPGELYIGTLQFKLSGEKVHIRTIRQSMMLFPEFDDQSV